MCCRLSLSKFEYHSHTSRLRSAESSLVCGFIFRVIFLTGAVFFVVFPEALILDLFSFIVEDSLTIHLALVECTAINEAISKGQRALTFAQAISPFTAIKGAIVKLLFALTMTQK